MPLRCPFCHASESDRVDAIDSVGQRILLVMFDCPFYYRFPIEMIISEEVMQQHLQEWRLNAGDKWLESVGPVMKAREMRNIERFRSEQMET